MDLLEAALSFALLMIIFSTLVATITETWVRVTAQRPRMLVRMTREFLKRDPFFSAWLEASAGEWKDARGRLTDKAAGRLEDMVDRLTENPALGALDDGVARGALAGAWHALVRRLRGPGMNRVDALTTFAFLQRVAKTEAGRQIASMVEKDRDRMADLLTDMGTSYERYVAASQEVFRKRTQAMTMVVSLAVAFAVNVDVGRIFGHLVDNPETRRALLAEAETVSAANAEALESLRRLLEMEPGSRLPEMDSDRLAGEVAAIRATLEDLDEGLSLPLGWEHSPFCDPLTERVVFRLPEAAECPAGEAGARACPTAPDVVFWGLRVLLAGFLIGLGGPFWYRFYTSLSSVVQLLRSMGGPVRRETISTGDDEAQPVAAQMAGAMRRGDRFAITEGFRIAADDTAVSLALGAAPR